MANKKNPAIQSEAEQQAQERNVANQKNPKILSEAEQQEQERMTKETIDAQEQVELLIFPDGNPAPLKVTINGVDYRYPKGRRCRCPPRWRRSSTTCSNSGSALPSIPG